jgi:hypothetical protein
MAQINEVGPMKSFRINARRREDGSVYLTSPDLPGLHVICPKDQDPAEALAPVLAEFLPRYYEAKLRNERATIRREGKGADTPTGDFSLVASVAI